jgi:hypothetical protein
MSQGPGGFTPDARETVPPQSSTVDVAREEASNVGQSVREAGGQVTQTASEQAQEVVSEARRQARDLVGEARQQASQQASSQQQKAAGGLRALGDELREMSEKSGQSGLASELAQQAADRVSSLASWLEQREPGDLLEEVRSYARRRPGMFLVGAAIAGVVAGRLTRGAAASAGADRQPTPTAPRFGDVTTTTPPARYGDLTSSVPPVSYGDVTTSPPPPQPAATPLSDYGTSPLDVPGEAPGPVRPDDTPEPGYPTYGAGPR